MEPMRITVLSGGPSGPPFVRALLDHLDRSPEHSRSEVTVICSTGDDISLWGLRVCPDLDRLVATLGEAAPEEDSQIALEELRRLGTEPQWFPVTDRELGTHVARTAWLGQGVTLSEVTARMARRHALPERVRVLPMSDVPVETHAVLDGRESQQAVHIQQWRHDLGRPPVTGFAVAGMNRATPAPGVLDAVRGADLVLLPPADPVLALGIVLGVPGLRDAVRGTSAPVVGVSPVVGRAGPDAEISVALGTVETDPTAGDVAGLYADLLDGWVVDPADEERTSRWTTRPHTGPFAAATDADLAATALALGDSLRP